MEEKAPKKPAHIPKEAVWNPKGEYWQLGDFKNRGLEQYWNKKGILWHENYRETNGDGWTKRYHPDGTIANYYTYKDHTEDGPAIFQRCKEPSPEFFPAGPHASVWKAEVEFSKTQVVGVKYFLEDGTEVPCYGTGEPDATLLLKSPHELLYGMIRNIDGQ